MSHSKTYTCGDCHFIALKRHLSKCSKPCIECRHYHKDGHVCRNHARDYCTNDNMAGLIDRTYQACEAEFMLSAAASRMFPVHRREEYGRGVA